MVTIKKDTINRMAFEREMHNLKQIICQHPKQDALYIREIQRIEKRLIEYVDEKHPAGETQAEELRIPKWLKTDVITVHVKDIGDYYGNEL